MRRLGTEGWAGLAMLVLAAGVAAPTLFGAFEPMIPRAWWALLFALFLAALFISTAARERSPLQYGAFAVAVTAAWAAVLTAQSTGLLLILLVITAATSAYVVPLWLSLVLVALNTGVVALVSLPLEAYRTEMVVLVGFYLLIQLATLLSSTTLIREQQMRRELGEAHAELKAAGVLLAESARTAERLRISRELHDLIGHQLTVLTLELETARHLDGPGAAVHLDRADTTARELLRDVRTTVGRLRSAPTDLERALREMTCGLPGLGVRVDVSPDVRLGDEHSAAFLRAAQEIVTNTLRHADAAKLHIQVSAASDTVTLLARDDGVGAGQAVFGNGLSGLRDRFTELGGDIAVDGSRGFQVTAWIPAP